MLGLVLIYFIGKQFYKLAEEFEKSEWKYAILGVLTYYGGTFLAGLIYEVLSIFFGFTSIENTDNFKLSLIALPFGILSCYLTYYFLKKNWEKNMVLPDVEIEKIGTSKDSNE